MEKLLQSKIQLVLSAIALLSVIFNVWIAAKLSPFAIDINSLNGRVRAIESFQADNKPLIERFYQLEERDKTLVTDVADIEKKVDSIDGKLDTLLNQHIELRQKLNSQ